MTPILYYNADRPVYIWELKQNFKVGEWEWGVTANHNGLGEYDIWLPQLLKSSENRKLKMSDEGEIDGVTKIIIPWQSLEANDKTSQKKEKPLKKLPRVSTTIAKQLALYVVIHSPLQMAADFIENYEKISAFQFIKDVPVDWDTTVVINGEIGEYVTIVRKDRNSEDWYLGSITNEDSRDVKVKLSFLDSNLQYKATIYKDPANTDWEVNPEEVEITEKIVSKNDKLTLNLGKGGGQAIRFSPIN